MEANRHEASAKPKQSWVAQGILVGSLVVSGAMTADFCASIGQDVISGVLLGGVGVLLEALKAFCWDRARGGRLLFWTVGALCSLFSLVASLAFATTSIEQGWEVSENRSTEVSSIRNTIKLITSQEEDLVSKVAALPADWVRSSTQYLERLESLRNQRSSLEERLLSGHESGSSTALATGFASRMGWSGPWFIAIMLGVISLIIEVAIVGLSLDSTRRDGTVFALTPSVLRFIQGAINADGSVKSRRELVGQGWNEREVRAITSELESLGMISREKNGLNLRTKTS